MPRLYLLDHSLAHVGGHHYEYDLQVLRAAEEEGLEPVLATHVQFRIRDAFPARWTVAPLFRHHAYSSHTVFFGHSERPVDPFRDPPPPTRGRETRGGLRSIRNRLWAVRDRRRLREQPLQFAAACRRLFERVPPAPGDQIFLPTISDFDLVGLVEFLRKDRRALVPDWHAQFHFGFLEGREPEHEAQGERVRAMRAHFGRLLREVPGVRLHLYCTTPQLASQYDLLEVGEFRSLPYPVNPMLAERRNGRREGPLRVVCAGGLRGEKGTPHLFDVAARLSRDDFDRGRLQLWVQAERADAIPRGGAVPPPVSVAPPDFAAPETARLIHVPHPVSLEDYVRLFGLTDIGLLLHDGRRYFARLSAILVELLCAGIPVVVPAASWLEDEIAEPVAEHLNDLARELRPVPSGGGPLPRRLRLGPATEPAIVQLQVPAGASELLVGFRWDASSPRGHHARVTCVQSDEEGNTVAGGASVCGRRRDDGATLTVFHVHPRASRVHLLGSNAFAAAVLDLRDVDIRFLAAGEGSPDRRVPLGRVGLAAADPSLVPDTLREMARHHEHFRRTAREFAVGYFQRHHPSQVVRALLATSARS